MWDKIKSIFAILFTPVRLLWRFAAALKSQLGTALVFLILLIVIVAIIGMFFKPDKPVNRIPKQDVALVLRLDTQIMDQPGLNKVEYDLNRMLGDRGTQPYILKDLIQTIARAADDDKVKALVLDFNQGGLMASPATLARVGEAIKAFKKKKKPVYAYSLYYDNLEYYLASFADHVWLEPLGLAFPRGYAIYNPYFKDLFDDLKVTMHVFKVGKYKSASEPFSRTNMSPAAKEEYNALLEDIWGDYLDVVRKNRPKLSVGNYQKNFAVGVVPGKVNMADLALKNGAVDKIENRQELIEHLINEIGEGVDQHGLRSFSQVSYRAYYKPEKPLSSKNRIAVVYVNGEIIDADVEDENVASGPAVVRLIKRAEEDDNIKALVLRVNSPGGSATASEMIRQAILDFKATDRPVVSSFGGLAASGGYYAAANSDEIWMQPTTITGSIGVFALIPKFDRTLNSIGIQADGVETTPTSTWFMPGIPLQRDAKAATQAIVNDLYQNFIGIVSEGRKIGKEKTHAIAQGRVWSGKRAVKIRLGDHLGDLGQAAKAAAKRAKIKDDDYSLVHMQEKTFFGRALLRFLQKASVSAFRFNDLALLQQVKTVKSNAGVGQSLVEPLRYHHVVKRITKQAGNHPARAQLLCLACSAFDH